MSTELVFVVLVLSVAAQRLWEVRKSAQHEARLRAAGAVEHAPEQMRWMRLVHAGWLLAAPLEVWLLDRPFLPALAIAASLVFFAGQLLRFAAMRALGERWTVRILTLPHAPPVTSGIFRHLRHPNYLGVILELAALPLLHGAWITAITFSVANGLLLWRRIRAEEAALDATGRYRAELGDRRRFVPHVGWGDEP